MDKKTSKADLLSIVVPVYNEQNGVRIFYQALTETLKDAGVKLEIIFINDGSTDNSWEILKELHGRDHHVKLINLSRNFGHQNALTAGIECAQGDAVVLMDMDMEDVRIRSWNSCRSGGKGMKSFMPYGTAARFQR
jgi:glycosyltransferase involved in cell wall biosynthesis